MRETLKKLRKVKKENCISIILTTHKSKPDYLEDSLRLKNMVKEVETRLAADVDKKKADQLMQKLHSVVDEIDHSKNIESLLIFVNEDMAEYVRIPVPVQDRVIIDNTFATRDFFRAIHLETHYFILVLSQEKIRLVEAENGKMLRELGDPFPYINEYYTVSKAAGAIASKQSRLLEEFFNQADKQVNHIFKENPLPVFICGLEENYAMYMSVADRKEIIFEVYLNKNKINDATHNIVEESWEVLKDFKTKRNLQRKDDLKKAVGENKFLSDTNEIWKAIEQGRVQTLFVEQGLFQPAVQNNGEIEYVSNDRRAEKDVIDDIYDEMIEKNMDFGGDVVFLPKGELDQFNGFGAITRY